MTIAAGGMGALIERMGERNGLGYLGNMGTTTTSTPAASTFTFGYGAGLWFSSPSTALSSLSDAFSNLSLPVAQGLVFVPAVAVGVLAWYLMSRK